MSVFIWLAWHLNFVSVLLSRPVKSPLKVQNGVQEADSPIKKVVKRSRQILDSDDDEAPVVKEQVTPKGQGDKETPAKKEKVRACAHSRWSHFNHREVHSLHLNFSVMLMQKEIGNLKPFTVHNSVQKHTVQEQQDITV